jgi:hypothetical protein
MIDIRYVGRNCYIIDYLSEDTREILWRGSAIVEGQLCTLTTANQYAENIAVEEAVEVMQFVFDYFKGLGCLTAKMVPFNSAGIARVCAAIPGAELYTESDEQLTEEQLLALYTLAQNHKFSGCTFRPVIRTYMSIDLR